MKKFLLTAVFAVLGACVFAQQKPVVAVAPFEVISGISTADANALTGVFYNRLGNANVVTLVDRSIVERVIREHQFQLEDWSNAQKTAEIGEALNADWIVRGRIESYRSNIIINVQFYDINTFQFRGGDDISLANADEAYEKMTPLVNSLVQTIRGTVEPVLEGLKYEIVDGRNVTITRHTGNAATLNTLNTLNIPSHINGLPVTVIRSFAFAYRSDLTSVTIPSSVTSIEGYAFFECRSLTSVTIPSSVTSIRYDTFNKCSSLTSITIPSSVTSIGSNAFKDCSSLTSVTIPSSVTSIGEGAFSDCSSLTSVNIPSSVTFIGHFAFASCSSLTSISIPSSVTSIGSYAFLGCVSLTRVTLSRRTQVGVSAFPRSVRITYRG